MAQQILQKRTYDNRPYDLLCAALLAPGATISVVNQMVCDPTAAALVFGTPAINSQEVIYNDGTIAPANTAIQVNIGGGAIPEGLVRQICTIRAQFTDSNGSNIEATALLVLTDEASNT